MARPGESPQPGARTPVKQQIDRRGYSLYCIRMESVWVLQLCVPLEQDNSKMAPVPSGTAREWDRTPHLRVQTAGEAAAGPDMTLRPRHYVRIPTLKLYLTLGTRRRRWATGYSWLSQQDKDIIRCKLLQKNEILFFCPTWIVQWNSHLSSYYYLYFTDEDNEALSNFPKWYSWIWLGFEPRLPFSVLFHHYCTEIHKFNNHIELIFSFIASLIEDMTKFLFQM